MKQVWQTDDGDVFDFEKDAKRHEIEQNALFEIKQFSTNLHMYAHYMLDNPSVIIDILQRFQTAVSDLGE